MDHKFFEEKVTEFVKETPVINQNLQIYTSFSLKMLESKQFLSEGVLRINGPGHRFLSSSDTISRELIDK